MAYCRLKCPQCDVDFGQESRFLDHLADVHGVSDHLRFYLDNRCGGTHPTCACSPGCVVKLPWAGWKKGFISRYARGHNARVDSVYLDKERQKKFVEKRIEGYKTGRNKTWNDGLTKATDPRVANASQKISTSLQELYSSGHKSWQVGLTASTDERIKRSSEARQEALDSGKIKVWNDGLTKNDHPSLQRVSEKMSALKAIYDPRRFTPERVTELVASQTALTLVTDVNLYRNRHQRLKFRCNTCGSEQEKSLQMLLTVPVCHICHPKDSKAQIEIYDFVRSLGVEAIANDRQVLKGRELDIYVPSMNLAIEYHGLYWHSAACQKDPKHDMKKHHECERLGISLVSVYEDEWRDKQVIVKSMIRYRLNKVSRRIAARKCSVKELSPVQRRSFFEANHLDGDVKATKAWGLFLGDELVSALSVRKPFHQKTYDGCVEVARFASVIDVSCAGALSRLTQRAIEWSRVQGATKLITYADSRMGLTRGYPVVGWGFVDETAQRFWWTDFESRFNRFKYKANKAKGLTQQHVADEAGVVQIFGCPNTLWSIPLV